MITLPGSTRVPDSGSAVLVTVNPGVATGCSVVAGGVSTGVPGVVGLSGSVGSAGISGVPSPDTVLRSSTPVASSSTVTV